MPYVGMMEQDCLNNFMGDRDTKHRKQRTPGVWKILHLVKALELTHIIYLLTSVQLPHSICSHIHIMSF